ncbi:MAG: hypothetical protein KAW14_10595 [Candidatus Aegiribacteria sp.]|nr:hypothetical protein [Candidatus Aegiribacteria sp.]
MEQIFKRTGTGFFGIIALGILLILIGIPFVGMTIMTMMLSLSSSRTALPLAVVTLVGVYLISDFTGALITATGSGLLAAGIRSGRSLEFSTMFASGAAAITSIFGTILMPDQSLLSQENMEALSLIYRSAGLSSSEIAAILNILLYILPSLLAIWAVTGTVAAAVAVRSVNQRRKEPIKIITQGMEIRLGLLPAWIMIAALFANLIGGGFPPYAQQAAVNISIFMILPYSLVGFGIFRIALRSFPMLLLAAVPLAIIFPPAAICILALSGIMDTWFDFRLRLKKYLERKTQE